MLISTDLYPDSSFHPDSSGLSQGSTDSCLHPNSGRQWFFLAFLIVVNNTVHIFILTYVNKLGRNDLITALINKHTICRKGEQSLQAYNYVKGRNHLRNAIDSFGKGFQVLKDHVLNPLMTGQCPCKSLQLWLKFHSLFLQNSFNFQKVLHNIELM